MSNMLNTPVVIRLAGEDNIISISAQIPGEILEKWSNEYRAMVLGFFLCDALTSGEVGELTPKVEERARICRAVLDPLRKQGTFWLLQELVDTVAVDL